MGVVCVWLAVKGVAPASLRADLDLRVIDEEKSDTPPDLYDTALPSGWHLFSSEEWDKRLIGDPVAARLSRNAEVVVCCIEEHVMSSSAAGWKHGQCVWSISHDPDRGVEHLDSSGKLPQCFTAIAEEHRKSQREDNDDDDADYIFDIPIDVAEALTSYRYDADSNDGLKFQALAFNRPPSLWKRLFG